MTDRPRGETNHCRERLIKYCQGQGLDLGCGAVKIKADAIGIDLYHPNADMKRDARLLDYYKSDQFDYVYSSHLLEEIQDTKETLKEWLRVLKPGGFLVLYQADRDLYYPMGHPACNAAHKHHFDTEELWEKLKNIGGVEFIHKDRHPELSEWSFELVVRKAGGKKILLCDDGISLLIPTFQRPQGMKNFALSVDATCKDPSKVEILFGVHSDDTDSIQAAHELSETCKIKVYAEIIDRYSDGKAHLSFLWNQLYQRANYKILGYFGDDVLFKTPGWDEEVRKEFGVSKTVLVLCNDVHCQMGKQATLCCTHKIVHEKIGFYLYPKLRRWYMDTFWDIIYRSAKRLHYRPDIITEHLHPTAFADRADKVYLDMEPFKGPDKILWESPAIFDLIQKTSNDFNELCNLEKTS